jgi:hypothetical protein
MRLQKLALAGLLGLFGVGALTGGLAAQQDGAPPAQNPFTKFDRTRFEAAATELGATAEQLAAFGRKVDEVGIARAADELVRTVVPPTARRLRSTRAAIRVRRWR